MNCRTGSRSRVESQRRTKGASWRSNTIQPSSSLEKRLQCSNLRMGNTSPLSRFESRIKLPRTSGFFFGEPSSPLSRRFPFLYCRGHLFRNTRANVHSVLRRTTPIPIIIPFSHPTTCHRYGPARGRKHQQPISTPSFHLGSSRWGCPFTRASSKPPPPS